MALTVNELENAKSFKRFSLAFRLQHGFMLSSVILLVFTGAMMWCLSRPDYTWWSQDSLPWIMSIDVCRWVHRFAGAILVAVCVFHLFYTVFTKDGRYNFIKWFPTPKDFLDVTQNSLYFLGLRKEPPRFGRFSYYEKFDYWAVYWGCVIMCGTGITMWFDRWAAEVIPWFPYELSRIIHADEAILATLALFIWHFYNVHFRPGIFPGSKVWVDGEISRELMMEDHPLEYEELLAEAKGKEEAE